MLPYNLAPFVRVGVAVAPMFLSLLARVLVGTNLAYQLALMGSATWLAMNTMLLA